MGYRTVQGHPVPDNVEAAVTVVIDRQIRHYFNGLRLHGPAAAGFLLYGFLAHMRWAQIAGYCATGAFLYNLFSFAVAASGSPSYRRQVRDSLLAQAVVRRSQR